MGERKSFFQRIFSKSETIIPIVLIVILLLILVLAFSGWDYTSIPLVGGALKSVFGGKQYNVLVIGQPTPDVMKYVLNNDDFKKYYNFGLPQSEEAFTRNPENRLKNFDFIIIDQSDSGTQYGLTKSIPKQLADALKNYVASGKSLMIVGNSAHRVMGYPDLDGWQAIFGEIVPGSCLANISQESPCVMPLNVMGILQNRNETTTMFEGIDQVPSTSDVLSGKPGLEFTLYPISHNGTEWFSIKDARNLGRSYAGIISNKTMFGGKVVQITFQEWGYGLNGIMSQIFEYIR
jgi:hypothetical protein